MSDRPEPDLTSREFRDECSVRRTARVLNAKRQSILEDLEQLIGHMALIVPAASPADRDPESTSRMVEEALARLGDEAFTQLVIEVMQKFH